MPGIYKGPQFAPTVPTIRISQGAGRGMAAFANSMNRITGMMADQQDREAVQSAKIEGRTAGAKGVPSLREVGTLRADAYNEAAVDTYVNQIDLRMRKTLQEYENTHAGSPIEFKKAADAYITGLAQEVQGVAPWMEPTARAQWNIFSGQSLTKITSNFQARVTDSQKATAFELTQEIMKDVERNAGDLFSTDPGISSTWVGGLAASWGRLEQIYRSKKPDGMPRFKDSDVVAMRQDFFDKAYSSGVEAWVDEQPNKIQAFRDLASGKLKVRVAEMDEHGNVTQQVTEISPQDDMSRTAWKSVLGYASAQMNADISALNREDRIAEKLQRETEDATSKDMHDLASRNEITEDWVHAQRDSMTPQDYNIAIKLARGQGAQFESTVTVIDEIEAALNAGEDAGQTVRQAYLSGDLTREDYLRYRQNNMTMQDKSGPGSTYKQLRTFMGGMSDDARSMMNGAAGVQFGAYLRGATLEFENWWNTFSDLKDPKTGEDMGRFPTYEEGRAKVRDLLQGASSFQVHALSRGFGQLPGGVKWDANNPNEMDVEATRKSMAERWRTRYGVTPETPAGEWPAAATKEADDLKRYLENAEAYKQTMGRLNALQ